MFVENKPSPMVDAMVHGGLTETERVIAEYECDTVVHLAAQTQVSTAVADPLGTLDANVRGTYQVLDACRKQKVKRVVVASSDKSYGDGLTPYQEAQSLRPHGIYATSKACADMLAQAYALEYGIDIAITRCGNLYGGGHTNWSTLIPGTIRSVLRGEQPRLRSSGNSVRDFLYIEDAVNGYLALIDSDRVGAFNFSGAVPPEEEGGKWTWAEATRVIDVVNAIVRLTGSTLEPLISVADGPGAGGAEIDCQRLDCSRAEAELDWLPKHTMEEGLTKTIGWYRKYFEVAQ